MNCGSYWVFILLTEENKASTDGVLRSRCLAREMLIERRPPTCLNTPLIGPRLEHVRSLQKISNSQANPKVQKPFSRALVTSEIVLNLITGSNQVAMLEVPGENVKLGGG